MTFRRFLFRKIIVIVGLLTLTACDLAEQPLEFAGFKLEESSQVVFADKTSAICGAIENAGYIMPYGPSIGWFQFNLTQTQVQLSRSGNLLVSIPSGNPRLFVLANANIPADLNMLPDAVSQETVDQLADDAKKICRIVQKEAVKQGIGPVDVEVWLWDLFVGTELNYGLYDSTHTEPWQHATSNCDQITGFYWGKSNGHNPEARTPKRCPSLYMPN